MNESRIPAAFRADVAAMPAALQRLLEAELDAGNEITAIGHTHPAPPVGAYAMLARNVSTRARAHGDGLQYRARSSSLSAGEFTDDVGFFYVLEPPGPPPEEPDMDAIRAAANAPRPVGRPSVPGGSPAIARFLDSMVIDYDKWHDGEGFDIEALREASSSEQAFAERHLVPPRGWRDVEALVALAESGRESARSALRAAMSSTVSEVRMAVMQLAPELVDEDTRTALLVKAVDDAGSFNGLDATLTEVEAFHPPAVVDALYRGLFTRDGTTAVHYAAMIAFVHGKATSAFDWSMRPIFLEFNTGNSAERLAAFQKLCDVLGVASEPLLLKIRAS